MLEEPLAQGPADVAVSSGGDDTIDLFEARHPHVVILTATLEVGDARSLIETLREMAPRAETGIIVVGDDTGPIRTALDAIELAPDRFVGRPLAPKALRFAVSACIDASTLARSSPRTRTDQGIGVVDRAPVRPSKEAIIPPPRTPTLPGTGDALHDASADRPNGDRSALRARWEALADAIGGEPELPEEPDVVDDETALPLPPPIEIQPRRIAPDVETAWRPGTTSELREDEPQPPAREPTLIIHDEPIARPSPPSDPPQNVVLTERGDEERWSDPLPLAELVDPISSRDSGRELRDDLDDFDDEIVVGSPPPTPPPMVMRSGELRLLDDLVEAVQPVEPKEERGGRDFARQLRAKMSMMAQRLFQNDSAPSPAVDLGPRHDHHTEIDLAALGEEPPLRASVTEIATDGVELTTSPGGWCTRVR